MSGGWEQEEVEATTSQASSILQQGATSGLAHVDEGGSGRTDSGEGGRGEDGEGEGSEGDDGEGRAHGGDSKGEVAGEEGGGEVDGGDSKGSDSEGDGKEGGGGVGGGCAGGGLGGGRAMSPRQAGSAAPMSPLQLLSSPPLQEVAFSGQGGWTRRKHRMDTLECQCASQQRVPASAAGRPPAASPAPATRHTETSALPVV